MFKTVIQKKILILLAFVSMVLALSAAFLYTATVSAQAQPPQGEPRCAITGFGPIACPQDGSIGAGPGCWVRDTSLPNPTWEKKSPGPDCNDPAFTPPQAIDCSANITPANDRNGDGKNDYCDQALQCTGNQCDLVAKYINPLIRALSALVGIGVTVSIIWAGIQYASSADDPQKVSAAKHRILVALLTLLGYFLFYQFLRWVIPGNSF